MYLLCRYSIRDDHSRATSCTACSRTYPSHYYGLPNGHYRELMLGRCVHRRKDQYPAHTKTWTDEISAYRALGECECKCTSPTVGKSCNEMHSCQVSTNVSWELPDPGELQDHQEACMTVCRQPIVSVKMPRQNMLMSRLWKALVDPQGNWGKEWMERMDTFMGMINS